MQQPAKNGDVLEQRPDMAGGEMDRQRDRNQCREQYQRRQPGHESRGKEQTEDNECAAAEMEQQGGVAYAGDDLRPGRTGDARKHLVVLDEMAETADDENRGEQKTENRIRDPAIAGQTPFQCDSDGLQSRKSHAGKACLLFIIFENTKILAMEADALNSKAGEASRLLAAMANQKRLMVLCSLLEGEKTAGALAAIVGLTPGALSQHFALLRSAGLVETRRDRQTIHYRLAAGEVRAILRTLYRLYCAPPARPAARRRR